MVIIYQRHFRQCPNKGTARDARVKTKCACAYWADGRPLSATRSLGTSDQKEAAKLALRIESGEDIFAPIVVVEKGPIRIEEAKEIFLASLEKKNLAVETRRKHETLFRQVTAYAKSRNLEHVVQVDANVIDGFIDSWADEALSRGKKIERFRQFFKFAIVRGWIAADPSRGMKVQAVKAIQKKPFTANEMTKILTAAETAIQVANAPEHKRNAQRMRAMILFMRYSGLRIGDAVTTMIEWVKGDRIQRYAGKNGKLIDVRLPKFVVETLNQIPPRSDLYFFWSGKSTVKTATGKWQERLRDLFKAAGIEGGHSHRFRHTFAVTMLERGESLQAVADSLGDTLKVVEKHYNPWSKTRQERLDEAVSSGWATDPFLKKAEEMARATKSKNARIM